MALFSAKNNKIPRNHEEVMQKLKPYFDAKILTDTIYTSEYFNIFVYGDLVYAAFPNFLFADEYPIGILFDKEEVVRAINDHTYFYDKFKYKLNNEVQYMLHFTEDGITFYSDAVANFKKTKSSILDEELNQRIKEHPTEPITLENSDEQENQQTGSNNSATKQKDKEMLIGFLKTIIAIVIFFILMKGFSWILTSIF